MKLNTFFIIVGVVGFVFGLLALIIPGPFYEFYGNTLTDAGKFAAQLQGSAYIGVALLLFFAVKASDPKARFAITLGMFAHFILGLVVALKWQIGGIVNAWGWSTVAFFGLLSLGSLYFLIKGAE
jgi:hypothetical protein